MKTKLKNPPLITLLLLLLSLGACKSMSFSETKSGKSGGGGTIVVDGETYHLKDLYFEPKEYGSLTFSKKLREHFNRLREDLIRNGGDPDEFFKGQIFKDLVEFRLVAQIPNNPICEQERQHLAANEKLFACTVGWITWIVPKYYQKLSLHEKMAAIVHERLHAYAPNQPHDIIMPFVKGVVTFLDLAARSREGEQIKVSDTQVDTLLEMRFRAVQLALSKQSTVELKKGKIHRYGGGYVAESAKVSSDAYVDVSSFIGSGTVGRGVNLERTLIDSKAAPEINDRVSIRNSKILDTAKISNNVYISDTTIIRPMYISDSVTIHNSLIRGAKHSTGGIRSNVRIMSSTLGMGG